MSNEEIEVKYKIPKDAKKHTNEFIVFFANEEDPKIIFHSMFPSQAFDFAQEISKKEGKTPTVIRVNEPKDNVSWLLSVRS